MFIVRLCISSASKHIYFLIIYQFISKDMSCDDGLIEDCLEVGKGHATTAQDVVSATLRRLATTLRLLVKCLEPQWQ